MSRSACTPCSKPDEATGYKNESINIETELDLNKVKFNLSYLEEKNYFLEQEYVQSKININTGQNTALSFGGKRNLLKDSSEYYNLAYEYFNDCLKAGIAYRREFYTKPICRTEGHNIEQTKKLK